jgi:hypothetical protein
MSLGAKKVENSRVFARYEAELVVAQRASGSGKIAPCSIN